MTLLPISNRLLQSSSSIVENLGLNQATQVAFFIAETYRYNYFNSIK